MRVSVLWVYLNSLVVARNGLAVVSLIIKRQALVAVCVSVLWVYLNSLVVARNGLAEVSLIIKRQALVIIFIVC